MKNGMRWSRPHALLAGVALAAISGICLAQNTNSGDLRGTALDPFGRSWRAKLALIALIPLRDCLAFGLFLASFAVRSVDWRGRAITLGANGRLSAKDPS